MAGSVGWKTTSRRWSTVGITPLSRTLDTPGVLARTVSDAAMAFAVIDPLTDDRPPDLVAALAGQELSTLRAGVCDWFFRDYSPGVADATMRAIDAIAAPGLRGPTVTRPEPAEFLNNFHTT